MSNPIEKCMTNLIQNSSCTPDYTCLIIYDTPIKAVITQNVLYNLLSIN